MMSTSQGNAAIAVDWGGDYVSSHTIFDHTTSANFHTETITGQTYSVLKGDNPEVIQGLLDFTPSSGYSVPTGKSGRFKGGWTASTSSTGGGVTAIAGDATGVVSGLNNRAVWNLGTSDLISIAVQKPAAKIRGMVVFSKVDFLNNLNTASVGFDENSSLTFKGYADGGYTPLVRWIIKDSDTWYVSETSFTGPYNTITTETLNDPNSAMWAAFTPFSADNTGPDYYNPAPIDGFTTHTFSNVEEVGLFFDSYGQEFRIDGNFARFGISNFTVNAVAVPEPSTMGMVGLGLISLGMIVLKRRVGSGSGVRLASQGA